MRKGEGRKREQVSVRLWPEQWEAMRALADRNRRSLNLEVQLAIEAHLAQNGGERR